MSGTKCVIGDISKDHPYRSMDHSDIKIPRTSYTKKVFVFLGLFLIAFISYHAGVVNTTRVIVEYVNVEPAYKPGDPCFDEIIISSEGVKCKHPKQSLRSTREVMFSTHYLCQCNP